jgi:hypothetical protein
VTVPQSCDLSVRVRASQFVTNRGALDAGDMGMLAVRVLAAGVSGDGDVTTVTRNVAGVARERAGSLSSSVVTFSLHSTHDGEQFRALRVLTWDPTKSSRALCLFFTRCVLEPVVG